MELQQFRSKRKEDGAAVVSVKEGMADEKGRKAEWEDWTEEEVHEIRDEEAVPEAGSLRVLIEVKSK